MTTAKINLNDVFSRRVDSAFSLEKTADHYYGVPIKTIPDINDTTDWFVSMVGGTYDLYGVDGTCVKLNDMVFEFLEDPDDGYRSHLGAVRISNDNREHIFFPNPVATIKLIKKELTEIDHHGQGGFRGYNLVDVKDGHTWAEMGTGNTQDYYPYFVVRWHPKEAR